MFDAYTRLTDLLELQRQALAEEDDRKLDETSLLIDEVSRQIVESSSELQSLDRRAREQLRPLIDRARMAVDRNMGLWRESLTQARSDNQNLQATKRYYSRFQNVERAGCRFSRHG
jgi:5-bromo-4-chloroindolyl phosphate hydrolysis protein